MNNFPSKKLSELVLHIQNGTTKKQVKEVTSLPVTRIETIADSSIDISKLGYLSMSEPLNSLEKYIMKRGDILFSHINSLEHLGKTAIYDAHPELLIHGMNLLLIRTNNIVCNPHFLNFTFKFLRKKGVFKSIAGRAIGQASINQGNIKNVDIPCPKLIEQRAIAKVLCTIQDAIEIRKKELNSQRELKEALMDHLFTYGTKNESLKETILGMVPQSWEILKIDDVIFSSTYGTSKGLEVSESSNSIPVLRMANIQDDRIDIQNLKFIDKSLIKDNLVLQHGDVLFNRTNSNELVGKVAYYSLEQPMSFASYLIRLKTNTKACGEWLFYRLSEKNMQNHIRSLATRGVSQVNVNPNKLKSIQIAIPPIKEQKIMTEILRAQDHKINHINHEIMLMNELFQAMLEELMTGKISTAPLIENCEVAS